MADNVQASNDASLAAQAAAGAALESKTTGVDDGAGKGDGGAGEPAAAGAAPAAKETDDGDGAAKDDGGGGYPAVFSGSPARQETDSADSASSVGKGTFPVDVEDNVSCIFGYKRPMSQHTNFSELQPATMATILNELCIRRGH